MAIPLRAMLLVGVGFFLSWACTYKFYVDIPDTIVPFDNASENAPTRKEEEHLLGNVWRKMLDFETYKEWSPYLYSIRPSYSESYPSTTPTSELLRKDTPLIFHFVVGTQPEEGGSDAKKTTEGNATKEHQIPRLMERHGKVIYYKGNHPAKKRLCWDYETSLSRYYLLTELDCITAEIIDEQQEREKQRKGRRTRRKADEEEDLEDEGYDKGSLKGNRRVVQGENESRQERKLAVQGLKGVRVRLWKWYSGPFSLVYSYLYHDLLEMRLRDFQKQLQAYLTPPLAPLEKQQE